MAGGVNGGGGHGLGGGAGGSVTDSHLVPLARAARVVPLSAVAFDGLSCLSSFCSIIKVSILSIVSL